MRRIWVALIGLGLLGVGVAAQRPVQTHATVAITSTVTGLPAATIAGMTSCSGRLETAAVRYWDDGTAPTASTGLLLNPGDAITVTGATNLAQFQVIATTSTSASLPIECNGGPQ